MSNSPALSPPARVGPLSGVRVVELGGIGPAPFCGMMLADYGAEVICLVRKNDPMFNPVLHRNRKVAIVDLKLKSDVELVHQLIDTADVVLEGFRPGVAERLDFDPAHLMASNPALVVGRITGYGRDGRLASRAGHDINYLALAGVLHGIGPSDRPPVPPLNLVADFGGGGMLLTTGVLAALMHAQVTGQGQVVDVSMVEGASLLMAMIDGLAAQDRWTDNRGDNLFDGSAPFYDCYECSDGRYVAVGAIEGKFFAELVDLLDVSHDPAVRASRDRSTWPAMRALFASTFVTRTRDEWANHFADSDACVTPVLTRSEALGRQELGLAGMSPKRAGVRQTPAPATSGTSSKSPARLANVTDAVTLAALFDKLL